MLQNPVHFVTRVGIRLKTSGYRYPHTGVYKCTWHLIPSIGSRDLANETAISGTRQRVCAAGSGIALWAPATAWGVQAPSAHAETCKWATQFNASCRINLSQTSHSFPLTSWPCVTLDKALLWHFALKRGCRSLGTPFRAGPVLCSRGARSPNCKFMSCQTMARAAKPR